jgi:hypothetical protein
MKEQLARLVEVPNWLWFAEEITGYDLLREQLAMDCLWNNWRVAKWFV